MQPVSIVIPVWNNIQYLDDLFSTLKAKTKVPYELIIIDNGSTDGSQAKCKEEMNQTDTFIQNLKNNGSTGAWNQGIRVSKHEIICLLNSDVKILMDGWLETFQKPIVEQPDKVGIVECLEIIYDVTTRWAGAACPLINKRMTREIGLFDEKNLWGFCLHPSNLIRTEDGGKYIDKIKVGNRVLTEDGLYQRVLKIFERKVNEDIYCIKVNGNGAPLMVTGNHKVLAIRGKKCSLLKDTRCKPTTRCSDRNCNNKFWEKYKPEYIRADELRKTDYLVHPIRNNEFDVAFNDEQIEFFGYYLAEGYSACKGKRLCFSIGSHETEFGQRILELGRNLGMKGTISKPRFNSVTVGFYSPTMVRLLENLFGKYAKKKKLNQIIVNMSERKKEILIKSMVRGDGYVRDNLVNYTTASLELALQLREMLYNLEYGASLTIRTRKGGIPAMGDKEFTSYEVRWTQGEKRSKQYWKDDNFIYLPVKKIRKMPYKGKVYNLNIGTNHNYVANGVIVSNCGDTDYWVRAHWNKWQFGWIKKTLIWHLCGGTHRRGILKPTQNKDWEEGNKIVRLKWNPKTLDRLWNEHRSKEEAWLKQQRAAGRLS